ncbi:MAG: hypothetical protein PHD36_04240 [Desulfotomaculaceae bacterium]|nr:hypothetical protein [Desulfotomaculaceae bacterium]
MSKKPGFEFADESLQETKKTNAVKLSDKELDNVSAGGEETLRCSCGSDDITWNNAIGFWICNKCKNVFN